MTNDSSLPFSGSLTLCYIIRRARSKHSALFLKYRCYFYLSFHKKVTALSCRGGEGSPESLPPFLGWSFCAKLARGQAAPRELCKPLGLVLSDIHKDFRKKKKNPTSFVGDWADLPLPELITIFTFQTSSS